MAETTADLSAVW